METLNHELLSNTLNYQNNFPAKLWCLVNHPQILSINWDKTGEGIIICKKLFESELMSPTNKHVGIFANFFLGKYFQSFTRQLNLYGFKMITTNKHRDMSLVKEFYYYHNPNFKLGQPELLTKINRLGRFKEANPKAGMKIHAHCTNCPQFLPLNSHTESTAVMENGCPSRFLVPNVYQPAVSDSYYDYYHIYQTNPSYPSVQYPVQQPRNVQDPMGNDVNPETLYRLEVLHGSQATSEEQRYLEGYW